MPSLLSLTPLTFLALATLAPPEPERLLDELVDLDEQTRIERSIDQPFVSIDRLVAVEDELDVRRALLAPRRRARDLVVSIFVASSARRASGADRRELWVLAHVSISLDALIEPGRDSRPAPPAERARIDRCVSLLDEPAPAALVHQRGVAARAAALACEGGSR